MRFAALRNSRPALVALRAALILLALVFFTDAMQSALVIARFAVPVGTGLWTAAAANGVGAAVSGVFALTAAMSWRWAVWAWAVSVATISVAGLAFGLNRSFLFRWEVVLPWILLAASAALGLRQATPWKHAA